MTARILLDLPEDEYHAHPALSQSGCKKLLQSPSRFRYEQDHPTHSKAFDFGSAAHALVLGRGMESIYVAPFDDWIRRKGPEGGCQYTTDEKAIAQADGLSPILPKDWEVVCQMADKIREHAFAMRLFERGEPEVSLFAELDGIPVRGRVDWLAPRVATDYKTSASDDPFDFRKKAATYGYHIQAAFYMDLLEAAGRPVDEFAFIVQHKDPPFDVFVTTLTDRAIAKGRELYLRALERYRDCMAADTWPGRVSPEAYVITELPEWAYYDNEPEEHYA